MLLQLFTRCQKYVGLERSAHIQYCSPQISNTMTTLARQAVSSCIQTRSCTGLNVISMSRSLRVQTCQALPRSRSSSTTSSYKDDTAPVSQQQPHIGDISAQQQHTQQKQQKLQASLLLGAAALLSTSGAADAAQQMHLIADLDAATAHTFESILRPTFAAFTVLYIIRITMTWYPNIDGTKLPWLLAYAPTEPILKATRNVIPLVGGVDVTPIVWVALISFFNEILLGPQGILMLIQRQSGAGLL